MPLSPVVDARSEARPEWREYFAATGNAIALLQALVANTGGGDLLKDRLSALSARIANLKSLAADQHERLVTYSGVNVGSGARGRFNHGLGTVHVFHHFRDVSTGQMPNRLRDVQWTDSHIDFLDDDMNPIPATVTGDFIGVISDRY